MEEINGKWFAIICLFTVAVVVGCIAFNRSFEKKFSDSNGTEVQKALDGTVLSNQEKKQLKESLGNIQIVVLRENSKNKNEGYSFELGYKGDKLLFSCAYYDENGNEVVVKSQEVGRSRMDDVKEIIDRYTVATVIRNYRKDPQSVVLESDDDHALELTWLEGDYINLGYPNGAGPALEKYFKKLASWLVSEGE